jgi:hypothetical protein
LPAAAPAVEVLRDTAQKDLAVDGTRSADNLASRKEHGLGLGRRLADVLPVVVPGEDVGSGDVSTFQLVRQTFEVWVIWPSFEQQYATTSGFG